MKVSVWLEVLDVKGVGSKIKWPLKNGGYQIHNNAKVYVRSRCKGERASHGGYLSIGAAEAVMKDVERKIIDGELDPTQHGLTLAEAIKEYVGYCKERIAKDSMAESTLRIYQSNLDKLVDYFGPGHKLAEVTRERMIEMRDAYLTKKWEHKYGSGEYCVNGIRLMIENISPMFGYFLYRGKLKANPCYSALKDGAFEKQDVGIALTYDQLVAIANACAPQSHLTAAQNKARIEFWDLLTCKLSTSMRIGQICGSMRDNYSNGIQVIPGRIRPGVRGNKNKADKRFYIPTHVRPIFERAAPGGKIFPGWTRGRAEGMWGRLRKRVGFTVRVRLHDLRHTFSGIAGNNPDRPATRDELGTILGHKSSNSTQVYEHREVESMSRHVEYVGSVIASIRQGPRLPELPSGQ